MIALWRGARAGGRVLLLGLFFAGALTRWRTRPGPAPELDVEGREIVILGGLRGGAAGDFGRARALPPGTGAACAGAGHAVHEGRRDAARAATTGRISSWTRGCASRAISAIPGAFDYARFLARQDIYWTASAAAGTVRVLPGRCGLALSKGGDGPARRGAGAHRAALPRRPVPDAA